MRTLITRSLLAALLLAPLAALSGPEHENHARSVGQSDMTRTLVGRLVKTVNHLDLDEAQRAAIHTIMQDSKPALQENHHAMAESHQALADTLMADDLDSGALEEIAQLEGELLAERIVLSGHIAAQVLAVLNDDQRAELAVLREHHTRKLHEHKMRQRGS